MKYYPMHMHLHTIHQPGASMESHIYNAYTMGMKYIRFTDHDTRTGESKKTVNSFDLTRGVLEYKTDAEVTCGLELIGEFTPEFVNNTLHISGGKRNGVTLCASGKKQSRALVSDVTLTLGMAHRLTKGGRIIIDILLSQRPPDHKEAHLLYVIGEPYSGELKPHYVTTPLAPREDGIYSLHISEDVERFPEIGGCDNVFGTVSIIIEGEGEIELSRLEISSVYNYDEVIRRQREVADRVGAKYGIKPFVTTEISGAGQHKNCFSTCVPVLDYRHGKITEEMAAKHVKDHGGIFAYNHPFESSKYKRVEFTREELDGIVAYESTKLIESRVVGASLMEVGFPMGRGLFTIADHLTLWDNLTRAGIFITGYGDSDSHKSHTAWLSGNNFASWIGVDESIPHPVPEEVFNAAMVAGRVYMGDPVLLRGEVAFTSDGEEMGSVIMAEDKDYPVSLVISDTEVGTLVKIIRDGECISEEITEGGRYEKTVDIRPSDGIDFVRAEMYHPSGRCIMLTNPIYFVKNSPEVKIPEERAVKL